MIIRVLGSAGWIPGKNETSCVMIEHNDMLFLLDAGTGISNLFKYKDVLEKYDTIHVILSHYHLDHTIGLIYLDPLVRNKTLRIYGPGKLAYPETTDYYIHALLRKEFFSRNIDDFSNDVECLDFPDYIFNIGTSVVRVLEQKHSAASFQIALDDYVVYATDTSFDASTLKNTSAKVLLHECWDVDDNNSGRHSSLEQLISFFPQSKYEKLVLIHQNPNWNENDLSRIKRFIAGTQIVLAEDEMEIVV